MKYGRFLWLPIGVGVACSSPTRLETENSNGGTPNQTPNGVGSPSGPGLQVQGSSLFIGAGTSGAGEPLGAEIPPSTAHDCVPVGISASNPGTGPADLTCYYDESDDTDLSATVERRLEIINDTRWIHLRLTFNPGFVDNTYGETAIGWGEAQTPAATPAPADADAAPGEPKPKAKPEPGQPPAPPDAKEREAKPKPKKGGHTFKDLVGSDHAEFQLFNTAGELTVQFKLDYIEPSESAPSGYASAGVTGGDGKMILGQADWILGATSSLDRNLNGCGWGDYTVDSPATDEFYSPNADAPTWDYRVVYEVWVLEEPFGEGGFGDARIEYVHASPSKYDGNTLIVVPGECPPLDGPDAAVPPPVVTTEPDAAAPPPDTSEPETPVSDGGIITPPPPVL